MKTWNFPERKRQRQLGALERLRNNVKKLPNGADSKSQLRELKVLEERTLPNRRQERSKKGR